MGFEPHGIENFRKPLVLLVGRPGVDPGTLGLKKLSNCRVSVWSLESLVFKEMRCRTSVSSRGVAEI